MNRTRVASIITLILLSVPFSVSAVSISELQAQLQMLLAQISVLQGSQGAAVAMSTSTSFCPNLTRNLELGMQGSDVMQLQQFLISQNVLVAGSATGYYGTFTESAVKRWQCTNLKICSGSPSTNGYGAVGPMTRAAISASCSMVSAPTTPATSIAPVVPTAPVIPAMQPSMQAPTIPQTMTGYWSIGNINTSGDYISETAAESNIAMIPPDETGSFIPRGQKASALGLKSVLMVRDTIFKSNGGELYPDYESRFIALWNNLGTLQGSVVGFYLIDEPYINNAGAATSQKLSESQLKNNLTNAISMIKRVAPGRPVMFTEGKTHVMRGDFASLIPTNLDYIGVNCYMYLEANTGCSDTDVTAVLQTLVSAMQPQQKLLVTADGYIPNLPPGYSAFSDEVLRSRIIYWENALAPYVASGKVGAFTPFIYQSVGDSISGLNEFPKSRNEIARYMQSMKSSAAQPKAVSELTSSSITSSGTYLDQSVQRVRDGNINTGWNSGGYAPQWIQFDLGEAYRIAGIQLTVGQSPVGKTTHVIHVSQTGTTWVPLETFSRVTATGDVLSYAPAQPPYGVRYVKIETSESPSWVAWPEISIRGY